MPRILVADDNTNIQKMVALAFEDRGVDVVSVGNGEAAVRRIPDLNPDLVLADVFMPVRNGYEVCEFVKKDERFSHIPVILLVGAFDPLDEKEARRVGADGVLKKPFVPPDPLIAMVMSALEKNPRVAAEMAKAKEAAAAPPPAEPMAPALEAPARMEPKPLPEFPEPTPEEAAQIYGFGKGVRADDDEATPAEERKAPKALSKKRKVEEEVEDEDDAASLTAHDWRRTAGDFKVPDDEPGGKLAFSSDEDFNPVTFPSERDVPPKHVRVSEEEVVEPAAQESLQSEAPAPVEAHAEIEAPIAPEPEPVVVRESAARHQVTAPVIAPIVAEKAAEPEPVIAGKSEKSEKAPEKSKSGGWMDMMTSPSEYSEGGWLSSLFKGRGDKSAHKQESVAPAESPVEVAAAPPAVLHVEPIIAASAPETAHADETDHHQEREQQIASGSAAVEEPLPVEHEDTPQPESWFAPPPPPVLREAHEPKLLPVSVAASGADAELISAPDDVSGALRDPELEEPAPARAMLEPLLMDDHEEPSEPSRFSRTAEPSSPLHSFFAPASGDPSASEAMPEDDPARHEAFDSPIFAIQELEPPVPEPSERIPTAPPPNREALADIPFLMPPPPSPFESMGDNHRGTDSASVDAVVARVLEKLEPQLHQLLSQGLLRPLVENLLQQELAKKEK